MKKTRKNLVVKRNCSICGHPIIFAQFSKIYKKLFKTHNKVESFLHTIDKYDEYIFNKGFNLKKYWNNFKNQIYCSDCLYDFYDAIHYHRHCFECRKEIYFIEAFSASYNRGITIELLLNYWLDPVIEFYCCGCFKKQIKKLKLENTISSF